MSNDSEKVNKNWKTVARFLPLLTLLVSVLILILTVETWYIDLIESLTVQISKYKQLIIVIITLFVGVSLLSFLTQIYMYADSKKANRLWKPVVTCFLLPLVLLIYVIMSFLILNVVTLHLDLLESLRRFMENKLIFTIIILFVGVSLLSFLFQGYMYVDPKKGDKTWKQVVAYFLLSFVLLVFVLILIFETWYPWLLKSLGRLIPDHQIYKQIIAIITLLAGMSLLSLLLKRYMNKDPEEIAKIWKIVACPVHFAIRLIAWAVLLIAIPMTVLFYPVYLLISFFHLVLFVVLFSILAIVFLSYLTSNNILEWHPELLQSLWAFVSKNWSEPSIIIVIGVLSSTGLFSLLFSKSMEDLRASLSNIYKKIVKVLRYKWWRKIWT